MNEAQRLEMGRQARKTASKNLRIEGLPQDEATLLLIQNAAIIGNTKYLEQARVRIEHLRAIKRQESQR